MVDQDKIPTDPDTIHTEIDVLLEQTPTTSDRGRLFWLIKAALDNIRSGDGGTHTGEPFALGSYTAQEAGTTEAAIIAAEGECMLFGTGVVLLSGINTEKVNIHGAIEPFVTSKPDLEWRVGVVNHTTPASFSYKVKTTVTTIGTDHGVAFVPDDRTVIDDNAWSAGDVLNFYLIPAASSGGAGGSTTTMNSVYRNSDPVPYDISVSATAPDNVPDGAIVFEATNANDMTTVKSVYISHYNKDGLLNDLLPIITQNYISEAESLGHLIFHGNSTSDTFDYYSNFKVTGITDEAGVVKFDIIPDPKYFGEAVYFTDFNGSFEWIFMPDEIAKKSAGGGGGASPIFKLGEWTVQDINGSIPNNDPVPLGQISLTSPVPGDGTFVAMSLVDANGQRVAIPFANQYGQAFDIVLWDEEGDTSEIGDRYKSCSFRTNPSSVSTSGNQINFYEVFGTPNSGNLTLVPGKKYVVFMVPVTSDLIQGFPNTIGLYNCKGLSIGSNMLSGTNFETDSKDVERITQFRIGEGTPDNKFQLLAMKVGDRMVINASGSTYLYEVSAVTQQAANRAFLLTVAFIDHGGSKGDLQTNLKVGLARA